MPASDLDIAARQLPLFAPMRRTRRNRRLAIDPDATAAQIIGPIEPGAEIHGVTNGQFSLIDMLAHVLDCIGPADVAVSTWTMGIYDSEQAERFIKDGRIRRIRWIVDPSMFTRKPEIAGALVEAFGTDSFRAVNTHAKFATLENDDFAVVIRTSMNLNRNERMESFDLSEDRELAGFYRGIVDYIFTNTTPASRSQGRNVFANILRQFAGQPEQDSARTSAARRNAMTLARLAARHSGA